MTIAELKQQNVNSWLDFSGTITDVGDIKERTKSQMSQTPGEPYYVQKIKVKDKTDEISLWAYKTDKIRFAKGQFVEGRGQLNDYQNHKYLDYCSLTIKNANVNQQPAPQSQRPQPASSQSSDGRLTDLQKEIIKQRGICLSYVLDAQKMGIRDYDENKNKIFSMAFEMATAVINGKIPDPSWSDDYVDDDPDPPPGDDDIPSF